MAQKKGKSGEPANGTDRQISKGSELEKYANNPRVRTHTKGPKMSDLLSEVAAPLLELFGDEEVAYTFGMTAWNLALLDEGRREAKMRETIEESFGDKPDLGHAVEKVLQDLVAWKLGHHPDVRRLMIRYFFEGTGSDRTLYVVSTEPKS